MVLSELGSEQHELVVWNILEPLCHSGSEILRQLPGKAIWVGRRGPAGRKAGCREGDLRLLWSGEEEGRKAVEHLVEEDIVATSGVAEVRS